MWPVFGKPGERLRTLGLAVGIGLFCGMTAAWMSSCANQAKARSIPNAKVTQVILSTNIPDPRLPPVLTATKVPQSTPVTPSKSTKGIELRPTRGTPVHPALILTPQRTLWWMPALSWLVIGRTGPQMFSYQCLCTMKVIFHCTTVPRFPLLATTMKRL